MFHAASLALALVYFIISQRVLDRFYLTDIQALAVLALVFLGTLVDIPLGAGLSINLGGLTAIGLAVYVWVRADTGFERARAIVAGGVAAGVLYLYPVLVKVPEPGLDLLYWHGPVAGALAYVLGRSRRAAYIGAVLSVLILDVGHIITARRQAGAAAATIAGGGAFDALVLAGISAVVLAEVVGEIAERVTRHSGGGNRQ